MKKLIPTLCLLLLATLTMGQDTFSLEKARLLVEKEVEQFAHDAIVLQGIVLSKDEEEKLNKDLAALKALIVLSDLQPLETGYTAAIKISTETETLESVLRFARVDAQWVIESLKLPTGDWISRDAFLKDMKNKISYVEMKGKIDIAMQDIKTIGTAIDLYIKDNASAPQAKTIQELQKILVPKYLADLPLKDLWGNDYLYFCCTGDNDKNFYSLCSAGSDGKFLGLEQKGLYTDLLDNDIIYTNGQFVFSPQMPENKANINETQIIESEK